MAALYKREGTSMFAGFAPLLLQWPFLSVMYLLFRSPTVGGMANTLLTHDLFGVPLGAHWLSGAGPLGLASTQGVVFVGLFALLAGLCWLSARLGRLMTAQATGASTATGAAGAKPAAGVAGAAGAASSPGLLVRALPYLIVVIAAFAPLAAGIYLLTTLAWSLAERMLYSRSAAGPEGLARPEKLAGKAGPLSAPTTDPAAGGSLRSGPA
jgi:YidC/Oxa1 family membrane protein insertase